VQLANKNIVVTGASDGIGKDIAIALAKKGANLALVARNQARLTQLAKDLIHSYPISAKLYLCDLQDPQAIKATTKHILSDYSVLDGLINNAGIWQKIANLENISDQEIDAVIATDLIGLIKFTKQLLPALKQAPESVIVNISSRSGISAQAGQSVYTAAKWGVKGFTEVLRADLKDTQVHVAGIYQGGTNTKMFEKAGENWEADRYQKFIPSEALGEVVSYLLSLPPQIWLSEIHVENK